MNRLDLLRLLAAVFRGDLDANAAARLRKDATLQGLAWIASEQLVSPALLPAFERHSLLGTVSDEFREYLKALYELNVARNERLLSQAVELRTALDHAGIRPIVLKGLAGIVSGLFPRPGERLIQDIDILVDEHELAPAREALVALGYRATPAPGAVEGQYDRTHQQAPLIHPSRTAAIEIHRRLLMSRRASAVVAAIGEISAEEVPHSGRTWRVPAPTIWFAHLWLHQMVQDGAYVGGRFDLRQLLGARRLVERSGNRIDWDALERAARIGGCLGEWGALGIAMERLLACPIPISARASALGTAWFWRTCAQYRWPSMEPWLRRRYRRLRRRLPDRLRAAFGWSGYGWKED